MISFKKEKVIAKKIKNILNKRGFIVEIIYPKNSKSVYLKIDRGACDGIRISNHKNNKTKYKFNMIKGYNGKRSETSNGQLKKFYNFNSVGRLIADMEIERSNKVIKFGYTNYKRIRDKGNYLNYTNYNKKVA